MYDNDGIGSPQMAVTPDFSMDEAMTMLDEYKGGHNTYPVAYDVVDRFVEKYEASTTPSDSAVMSGRKVDTSIANFDISLYNEIKISSQEMRELQSEALTWDADKRNVPLRRTLSSGIEYLYSIDSDGIVHIYERKQSNNIHEWSNEYDNRDSAQLDSSFERFRDGQRYKDTTMGIMTLAGTDENREKLGRAIVAHYDETGAVTEEEILKLLLMIVGKRKQKDTNSTTTEE